MDREIEITLFVQKIQELIIFNTNTLFFTYWYFLYSPVILYLVFNFIQYQDSSQRVLSKDQPNSFLPLTNHLKSIHLHFRFIFLQEVNVYLPVTFIHFLDLESNRVSFKSSSILCIFKYLRQPGYLPLSRSITLNSSDLFSSDKYFGYLCHSWTNM